MEKTEKYEVTLFGQTFVLTTSDGEKEELKKVVEYYKTVLNKLSTSLPNKPQLDIAILAGLKVTDKLYSLSKKKNLKLDVNKDDDDEKLEILNNAIKRLEISITL